MTELNSVYDKFFSKITDDMYLEWTKEDTEEDCFGILCDSVPGFEFPRQVMDFTSEGFSSDLTSEEINILASLMVQNWVQRQMTSIEVTRMKYTGTDFKMTSQANHLSKLINLKTQTEKDTRYLQRLYKRRKTEDGQILSNWSCLRTSALE